MAAGLFITWGVPLPEARHRVGAHRPMAGPEAGAQTELLEALAARPGGDRILILGRSPADARGGAHYHRRIASPDWATISALATAWGDPRPRPWLTLSPCSLLIPSRLQDPPQKIMWAGQQPDPAVRLVEMTTTSSIWPCRCATSGPASA